VETILPMVFLHDQLLRPNAVGAGNPLQLKFEVVLLSESSTCVYISVKLLAVVVVVLSGQEP